MEQQIFSLSIKSSSHNQRSLIFDRLRQDHRCFGAYIEILEHRLCAPRIFKGAASFTEKLINRLTDAPDEYHHHLERSAFHRLRARMGRLLPNAYDLDHHHEELRERRGQILDLRDNAIDGYRDNSRTRAALLDFCAFRRSIIVFEEKYLFPLFLKNLDYDDWVCFQEEAEAYDALVSRLASMKS